MDNKQNNKLLSENLDSITEAIDKNTKAVNLLCEVLDNHCVLTSENGDILYYLEQDLEAVKEELKSIALGVGQTIPNREAVRKYEQENFPNAPFMP